MSLSLVTEQTIRDYFKTMAAYGDDLQKSLEKRCAECAARITKEWDETKAAFEAAGQDILATYQKIITTANPTLEKKNDHKIHDTIKEQVGLMREHIDKTEDELLGLIEKTYECVPQNCEKQLEKCYKTTEDIAEYVTRKDLELPKIHIGNTDYQFHALATTATRHLIDYGNNVLFTCFKNKNVVNAAVEAFRNAGVY